MAALCYIVLCAEMLCAGGVCPQSVREEEGEGVKVLPRGIEMVMEIVRGLEEIYSLASPAAVVRSGVYSAALQCSAVQYYTVYYMSDIRHGTCLRAGCSVGLSHHAVQRMRGTGRGTVTCTYGGLLCSTWCGTRIRRCGF